MLTKNQRTHYILIKEWEKNQIKKIPITKAQHDLYEEELQTKKHNDFFKVHDIDTQEVIFNWRASRVEWFEDIKRDSSLQEKRWVCDYWTRHEIVWFPDNCNCKNKFWTLSILFKDELKKLWYNIFYNSDITKEMQEDYLRNKI
jgi:hypothetical protein